ncbi:TPA: helix-turn-helix transcriptional regulator [Klebsiella michiganensis]|jgi:DNA-binding HxlR family transcriptional regulator|uniref:Putative transcriptional regulator n=2 Tax=Klebsiella michiganensis TaxID=1134687 RepID=A0A0H3HDS5_KLEM8|nr:MULTISPECIES: helix-turn-helix domain-containing protein [Enterobacterales]HDH7821848.1 helix-turn-helix transcriptional regulator [Raoultella planticola]AEX06605.1 putative transcriptional regulator [Klebsiella michiganensis KCTC 1686]EJD6309565.1 helix-turn-helix transcriptional regulator [Raoultella ornithinolytica]MCG8662511.1 helix-turn-helix transcriptional regulator [Klebsiella michiganensis]HDH7817909.1 helix-turn-helix transcriptional regulator [Raoultella ornithinolytica]
MIPGVNEMDREEILQYSQAVCKGLRDDDDGLRREVLAHAGSRWSLGIVNTLGVYGRLRHAEIGRRMHGVTQRMLTRTLRQLERDGLVIRHDFSEIPPRVEYELSDTGMELLVRMIPLWTWIVDNADRFREDRLRYEKNNSNPGT